MCDTKDDCPGADTECLKRVCTGGVCDTAAVDAGTPISLQVDGDCKSVVCDGNGGTQIVNQDDDAPPSASKCVSFTCNGGTAEPVNASQGTKCGPTDNLVCDASGNCLGCNTKDDCPGTDTACRTRTCNVGVCGFDFAALNTDPGGQEAGNCQKLICDGAGNVASVADDADVPADDGKQCTSDTCALGQVVHPNKPINTACSENGGSFCTAGGTCVQCNASAQCPAGANECQLATCSASNTCGITNIAATTPTVAQTANDCKTQTCDGNGGFSTTPNLLDVPASDNNPCTVEGCDADGTTSTKLAQGTVCDVGTGNRCDASSQCVSACADGLKDNLETDVDCGGGSCDKCASGKACLLSTDCASGICSNNLCVASLPKVISTTPASGALVGSGSVTEVTITFDQDMDLTSVTGNLVPGLCGGSIQISSDNFAVGCADFGTPTLSADKRTVTLPLTTPPTSGTYQIRVTTGVKGTSGASAEAFTTTPGFTLAPKVACTGPDVVISQVYGGGGNSGAIFTADFIELHNRSGVAVSLKGWSLQYANTGANFGAGSDQSLVQYSFPDSASIAPGGYLLVAGASGGSNGTALSPAPDFVSGLALGKDNGKVVLVSSTATVPGGKSGSCPTSTDVVDFVGYGSADCSEGTAVGVPGASKSVTRRGYGCTDTNGNSADLTISVPVPHNSGSPAAFCGCNDVINNETDTAVEADYCAILTASASGAANASLGAINGELYEKTMTDSGADPGLAVAQVGIAAPGAAVTSGGSWAFFDAAYTGATGNNWQYSASIKAPAATGSFDMLYRISIDGKKSWTYCDKNGAGSNDGLTLETTQRGTITVP